MNYRTVHICELICDSICASIEVDALGKWRKPVRVPGGTGMSIFKVGTDHLAYQAIASHFPDQNIHTVRVHRFDPGDCVGPHTDTAFPGCDVVIIRLDGCNDSRLKVDGTLVNESKGVGFYLPEHTVHEIIKGTTPRYTLVAWFVKDLSREISRT